MRGRHVEAVAKTSLPVFEVQWAGRWPGVLWVPAGDGQQCSSLYLSMADLHILLVHLLAPPPTSSWRKATPARITPQNLSDWSIGEKLRPFDRRNTAVEVTIALSEGEAGHCRDGWWLLPNRNTGFLIGTSLRCHRLARIWRRRRSRERSTSQLLSGHLRKRPFSTNQLTNGCKMSPANRAAGYEADKTLYWRRNEISR